MALLVPDENVAAVAAANDELTVRSLEVDPLDCGAVPVSLVLSPRLRSLSVPGVEEVNILVIVRPDHLLPGLTEDRAGDVGLQLVRVSQYGGAVLHNLPRRIYSGLPSLRSIMNTWPSSPADITQCELSSMMDMSLVHIRVRNTK